MLLLSPNGGGDCGPNGGPLPAGGLHANLDSGNLRRFATKNGCQAGFHLPEFGGHRAVRGVDDNLPQLEVGNP